MTHSLSIVCDQAIQYFFRVKKIQIITWYGHCSNLTYGGGGYTSPAQTILFTFCTLHILVYNPFCVFGYGFLLYQSYALLYLVSSQHHLLIPNSFGLQLEFDLQDAARQNGEPEVAAATPVPLPAVPGGPGRFPPCIEFGKYEIQTWYSSPYPQEYAK